MLETLPGDGERCQAAAVIQRAGSVHIEKEEVVVLNLQLKEEHRQCHMELYDALLELIVDFMMQNAGRKRDTITALELQQWSQRQAREPDHEYGDMVRNQD
jgi:hypothetical protein